MENKIKRSLIHLYTRQGGRNWSELGRAIDWRIQVVRRLTEAHQRERLNATELFQAIGSLTIQRQIEDELDQYQQALQDLSIDLQEEEIDQEEYQERLMAITAAIFLIAFFTGSDDQTDEGQRLLVAAQLALETQGQDEAATSIITSPQALAAIPEEAQAELEEELSAAETAGVALASSLATGVFEDRQDSLFIRLAMWVTTALGIFALGQATRPDDPFLQWLFNPLKDHCSDCIRLNEQVHTANEWRNSGWRPQGRNLECGGWRCGCVWIESEGPSAGNF